GSSRRAGVPPAPRVEQRRHESDRCPSALRTEGGVLDHQASLRIVLRSAQFLEPSRACVAPVFYTADRSAISPLGASRRSGPHVSVLRGLPLHAGGSAEMVDHLVVLELRSLDDGRREFRIGADIAVAHALRCLLRVWI